MSEPVEAAYLDAVALRTEGVDRNANAVNQLIAEGWSPSARRAWIEITTTSISLRYSTVALRTEGVDRNAPELNSYEREAVALRTEGVDRNALFDGDNMRTRIVALRTEGVDRNK